MGGGKEESDVRVVPRYLLRAWYAYRYMYNGSDGEVNPRPTSVA